MPYYQKLELSEKPLLSSEMTNRVVLFNFTQCSFKICPEDMRHDQESILY